MREATPGVKPPAKYDAARKALAAAVAVDEVEEILDIAIAAQVYAQQAQDFAMINDATEIRERAERLAGEKLAEMEKAKADRPPKIGSGTKPISVDRGAPTLREIGVTKTQSSRWPAKAKLSDDEFEQHLDRVKRNPSRPPRCTATRKS